MPGPGVSWAWAAAALGLVVLTPLAVVLAALVERSGPIRLRHWAEEAEGRLRRLYDAPARFEAFRFLLSWLARLLPLALYVAFWRSLAGRLDEPTAAVAALAVAAVALGGGEAASRILVSRDPERALRALTGLYRMALLLSLLPVGLLGRIFAAALSGRREDEDEASDDEIEAFLSVGSQEGILDAEEQDLVHRVIDFGDTLVRSVMTPRTDMVCAPIDSDLEALAELFLSSLHSRVPVYRESVDEIAGVLHIRDLLGGLRGGSRPRVEELMIEAYLVPETKPLGDLLRDLQAERQQMAIVVDEFGGTSGLVTVEDVLEEIVGEIEDEHELETSPDREALEDGSWRLDGGVSTEVLAELFDVEVEEEPYETVGGLLFGRLGYLPEAGEEVESLGLGFRVERVIDRRIRSVRVRRAEGGEV